MPHIKTHGSQLNMSDNISNVVPEVGQDIRFRKLIENSHDGIMLLDKDLKVVYRSSSAERIDGWNTADGSKQTMNLLIHPGDREQVQLLLDELLINPGLSKTCSFRSMHFDGHFIWVESTFTNFLADPDVNAIVCNFRDISEKENSEQQETLLSEISLIFNETLGLNESLHKVLARLVDFGDFSGAEFWLISADKKKINNVARFAKTEKLQDFVNLSEIKSFAKGEGLVGIAWETNKTQYWYHKDNENEIFKRAGAAKKAGLKRAYALPLVYNEEIIGVLALGVDAEDVPYKWFITLFENLSSRIGAEIKRKQLEQELNQIFNFTPDILCITNTDGYFKKVNPAMSVLLEYDEQELLSKSFIDIVHPHDKEKSITKLKNIIAGKPTHYIENRYITKSGKTKWLAWTTTGASEQGIVYCAAKDITYKKELEELLNKATTLARIGSWEIDLINESLYWSDITKEIHEVEPDFEPDIETAVNFYVEGYNRNTITQLMEDSIKKGKATDVELQIVTAKGNIKWVRVIGEAEMVNGECIKVVGSFQDIDARKKAEIAGKKALEERNTILESIGDAFFAVDKNWVVTYWNNMAEKVLGRSKSEIINHNLWEVYSDSIDSESYKKYNQALETNLAVHFEDYYSPVKKWYEISAYPADKGLSVYFKDITDRKLSDIRLRELNESLQKHMKELAISNMELEQFAYVASHDLQEPLRMVTSFMTLLEKKYGDIVDNQGRQYIYFAVDGAKRMRQIILDLLEFSRVGRMEDDLEEINFNKLINEILSLYRKQIEEVHASVSFDNLPTLQIYRTPTRQVLQNLISNSLKYHSEDRDPVINISFKETKKHWQFAVKDNGIGIDAEYFDKIFIIFQRLHNKDEYSGTGMGLAIAKKIVESLGGKIWVESVKGKGSTFHFTLLKNNKS